MLPERVDRTAAKCTTRTAFWGVDSSLGAHTGIIFDRAALVNAIYKHSFLEFSKDFRLAGFRLDDDLTKSQQLERNSLSLDFQSLKTKGYQPYFRGSLLQY